MTKPHINTALVLFLLASIPALATGDATRGAEVFRACAGCHSLNMGDHRTGPSLANIFGRRAGTAEGFHRYSAVLAKSGVVWSDKSLDDWLRNPAAMIPGNAMAFRGLPDALARDDLTAYLRAVSAGKAPAGAPGTPPLPDLKKLDPRQRVTAIRYCLDTYYVTLGDGEPHPFWEFNLRFKTDSSAHGPLKGQPVIVGNGMVGDRAQVIFSEPVEISAFVRSSCQ